MRRYIDADRLKKAVEHELDMQDLYLPIHFFEVVDGMEAADVQEVRHGRWIKNDGRYGWHCSVCGEDDRFAFAWNIDTREYDELQDHYCPNCGASMCEVEE